MVVGNPHAATIQGVEHGIGETVAERGLDVSLSEHVYRAPDAEAREARGAQPIGLALVDEGHGVPFDGAGDGCGLAVIEGLGCGSGDEVREMDQTHFFELGMLDEVLLDQYREGVSIRVTGSTTGLKLQRDLFDNDTAVGQCTQDRVGASRRVQIDDDARIGDDGGRALIEGALEGHPYRFRRRLRRPALRAT